MASFRARGLIGDTVLVLGVLVLLAARIADDWWWFLAILAAGAFLMLISLVAVPFESHVAWIGRAPLKDPNHELNLKVAKEENEDAI